MVKPSPDEVYEQAMAEAVSLGLMSDGHATDRCQCPTCGAVFSTDGNFRRHLTRNRYRDGFDGPWCRPPADVGLIETNGVWRRPGPDPDQEAFSRPRAHRGKVGRPKRKARA